MKATSGIIALRVCLALLKVAQVSCFWAIRCGASDLRLHFGVDSRPSSIRRASNIRVCSSFLRSLVHFFEAMFGPLPKQMQSNANAECVTGPRTKPYFCTSFCKCSTKANGTLFNKFKAAAASIGPMLNAFMTLFFRLQSFKSAPVVRPRISNLRSWCKWLKQLGARRVAALAIVTERDAQMTASALAKCSKTECTVQKVRKTSASCSCIVGAKPASATTVATSSAAMDRFQPLMCHTLWT